MRLTASNPSFVRPLLPAGDLPAIDVLRAPVLNTQPLVLEQREPRRTPMSIEDFVRFARNAGAI